MDRPVSHLASLSPGIALNHPRLAGVFPSSSCCGVRLNGHSNNGAGWGLAHASHDVALCVHESFQSLLGFYEGKQRGTEPDRAGGAKKEGARTPPPPHHYLHGVLRQTLVGGKDLPVSPNLDDLDTRLLFCLKLWRSWGGWFCAGRGFRTHQPRDLTRRQLRGRQSGTRDKVRPKCRHFWSA